MEEKADKSSTGARKSQPFRAESGRKGRQNQHRREKRVSPFEQKIAEKADKASTGGRKSQPFRAESGRKGRKTWHPEVGK